MRAWARSRLGEAYIRERLDEAGWSGPLVRKECDGYMPAVQSFLALCGVLHPLKFTPAGYPSIGGHRATSHGRGDLWDSVVVLASLHTDDPATLACASTILTHGIVEILP